MGNDANQPFYNLTVFCEGSTPGFIVDETTLNAFKKSFESNEGAISFKDRSDGCEVTLRGPKLAGFKNGKLDREAENILREIAKES